MSIDAAALRGNWNYPTSVKFGCGRISELADHCKALGMKRPLLITDPGLADLPMVKQAIERNKVEVTIAPLTQRAGAHLALVSPSLSVKVQSGSAGQKAAEEIASGHSSDKR